MPWSDTDVDGRPASSKKLSFAGGQGYDQSFELIGLLASGLTNQTIAFAYGHLHASSLDTSGQILCFISLHAYCTYMLLSRIRAYRNLQIRQTPSCMGTSTLSKTPKFLWLLLMLCDRSSWFWVGWKRWHVCPDRNLLPI